MHPSMDELLALRDGEAQPWVSEHVGECPRCRRVVDDAAALRDALRQLPDEQPSRDLWPDVAAALLRGRRRLAVLRVAAALVVGGTVAALIWFAPGSGVDTVAMIGNAAPTDAAMQQLMSTSRQLEDVLSETRNDGRVMTVREAALIADLEDRIAALDAHIEYLRSAGAEDLSVVLWADRVELLDALVRARSGDVAWTAGEAAEALARDGGRL